MNEQPVGGRPRRQREPFTDDQLRATLRTRGARPALTFDERVRLERLRAEMPPTPRMRKGKA